MEQINGLAYQTICEATSAEAILYGSFCHPESRDLVIVKGRSIALYTVVGQLKEDDNATEKLEKCGEDGVKSEEEVRKSDRKTSEGHIRFVTETSIYGPPLSAHVLEKCIFHSYERSYAKRQTFEPLSDSDEWQKQDVQPTDAEQETAQMNDDSQTIASENIRATSAILLAFANGRICIIGYDDKLNRFVTLSMHVLERRQEVSDDAQYMSQPLGDKLKLTTVKDVFVTVCNYQNWHLLARRRIGRQRRVAVYVRRYIVAYCHDERLVTLLTLCSEFSRPGAARKYNYEPYSEYLDCNVRPIDGDHHSVIMVPWLRIESLNDLNVDNKIGFCEGGYFVRGMSFSNDNKSAILGLLVATKPELIGAHSHFETETTIGGMSLIAISVNPETRTCKILQRLDTLPMDTEMITGIPPSVFGTAGFICRSLDFVMWHTALHPKLYWQFTSKVGLLNTNFCNGDSSDEDFRFRNAMALNLSLRDYTIECVGSFFLLIPRFRGPLYIGRPVRDTNDVLSDILWVKCGHFDFEVSSSQVLLREGHIDIIATGSGFEIFWASIVLPDNLLDFKIEPTDDENVSELCEVAMPEVPTKVAFGNIGLYERFLNEVKEGHLQVRYVMRNSGVVRDPKNVTLPELWQLGCTRPSDCTIEDQKMDDADLLVHRSKPHRRPYAPNDRQLNVVGVDYVWPKQQSMVGLCDDSRILLLLEKAPIEQVLSVPLQPKATLVPLLYNHSTFPEKDSQERPLDKNVLITWNEYTATMKLSESAIDISCNVHMERRQHYKKMPQSDASPFETDERTLAYATVKENRLAMQVTRSKAVFIDLVNYERVGIRSLVSFDTIKGSTVKAAEITDRYLICLFTGGHVAALELGYEEDIPTLTVTHRITRTMVRFISLYRPCRLNRAFSTPCLLVLTERGMLFCYEVGSFEQIFAFSGLEQVHPRLFNEYSESLDFVNVMDSQHTYMETGINGKRSLYEWQDEPSKRAAMMSYTSMDARYSLEKSLSTSSVDQSNDTNKEDGTVAQFTGDTNRSQEQPPGRTFSDQNVEPGTLATNSSTTNLREDEWKKEKEIVETLEYVISVQMLDISPQDQGPTLVMFMTGRPVIIYRSYFRDSGEIIFQLHKHRFTRPLPSAVAVVEQEGLANERIAMRLKADAACISNCVSRPIVSAKEWEHMEQEDINHSTLCYPDILPEETVCYLLDIDCNEITSSVKPITESQIAERPDVQVTIATMRQRWADFVAPCLKISSINNRMRIHEYEIENTIDIETIHGVDEARVSSVFSIVIHETALSRYLLFLTRPGTLVLCVPGFLEQKTAINGSVTLPEIVAGSDDPDFFGFRDASKILWNPHHCRLETDNSNLVHANLYCRKNGKIAEELCYNGDFISQTYDLDQFRANLVAVSHKNYYLSNQLIRANRNATIVTITTGEDIHEVYCGKLVAMAVRYKVNAKEELTRVLNERINLQLRQLEFETLPPGTKPLDIVEPNKQICTLLETLEALPDSGEASHSLWRDMVIVLHMGNLHYWFGEYLVEPMESVLSMSFGIIGNREYLLIGTCTNLGENVESKGDVIVLDLQPMFQRQPNAERNKLRLSPVDKLTRSPTCAALVEYCKKIFPGPISFISSLNTDFDMLLHCNSGLRQGSISRTEQKPPNMSEEDYRWTVSHFTPNFGIIVHSVGSRLFVHEVAGKQFLRGAFAEVPLCVSSACVFDKYVVAGDLNMGLHFFIYRQDAVNDSRTLCKISSTVRRVDLSIVACAPLMNDEAIGIIASDYYSNIMLFKNDNDEERNTLVVEAAVRLPTRVTSFLRREADFRRKYNPWGCVGFSADGSCVWTVMPESGAFEFLRSVQETMESLTSAPLGVPRTAFSRPLVTSQMAQTQPFWPEDTAALSLDVLSSLPFQTAWFLETLTTKISAEHNASSYQILNALSAFFI